MNTVEKREEVIEGVMREFEKTKDFNWAYLTGFYANMLCRIAADRPRDTQDIIKAMQAIMKETK